MKKTKLGIIAAALAIVLAFGLFLLFRSGTLNKTPEVTVVSETGHARTLTVITDEDYSPYSFYDGNGNFSGHDVELIILVANELDMDLDLRFMNWYEAIDAMDAGEADILMTCDYSDTFPGVEQLVKCEPVSLDDFIVYSREPIRSSDELYGKRIAIMRNGNVSAQIDMMNLGRFCILYEDNRQAMQALISGEADCAIMRQTVGSVLLQELNAGGVRGYISIGQSFMCFGVRDEETAEKVNGAIETLKMNGEMDRLHEKWLTTFVRPYTLREIVENNIWVVASFLALAAAMILSLLISRLRKKKKDAEQQKQLRGAYDAANIEKQRFEMITGIIDAERWSYEVSADDRVISARYGDVINNKVDADSAENQMLWVELVHEEDREHALAEFMAAIYDHSGKRIYDVNFRILDKNGKYRWSRSVGKVQRREDGTGEFFGMSMDVTDQIEEQQRRLLGAVPISPDILEKENIGMWAFELDEGLPPRMYGDEAMLRLVGLEHQVPPEEMYHAWYDHIDEGSYQLVTDAVNRMASGEHAEVQYPWHHPDGHTMIVRCGGVRNPEYTRGMRIEGTHQNVTEVLHFDDEERKALAENNTRILALEDSFEVLYDVELSTGRYDIFVKGQTFGAVTNSLINNNSFFDDVKKNLDVVHPEDQQGNYDTTRPEFIREALAKDDHFDRYYRLMVDGKPSWARMRIVYKNAEKKNIIIGVFNAENDVQAKQIAEQKEQLEIQQEQLEEALSLAEAANRAKSEFLFNMSHDIRTPMNAILGYTDIGLRHVDDPEKSADSYRKIKTAGGHLLNLINDILEMSRIEYGKLELNNEPVDIRSTAEVVRNLAAALAEPKRIDFEMTIGELKNPYIYADELHGNEVFINLISNAVKYTPEGGRVRYRISQISDAEDGKAVYRFEVSDNGIGMSEEFQKHLFETFSRERTSTVSRQEGAGLGLAIVKRIVDLAGGTVRVSSKLGEGSVFTVEVPLRVLDEAEVEAFRAAVKEKEKMIECTSLEGRKVLLVEDNEMNREIAEEILTEAGLIIETAEDGEIAVKTVIDRGVGYYDFILMDIQMPVMDGYEATKALRALPDGEKLKIIALSANAFEEDKARSVAAGMNDHVAKPIEVNTLFECLKKYV